MASAISRGGRRADLARAIATGLARSPISGWAGAASGTAGGSEPIAAAAALATAFRIDARSGASATDGELTEPRRSSYWHWPSRGAREARATPRAATRA